MITRQHHPISVSYGTGTITMLADVVKRFQIRSGQQAKTIKRAVIRKRGVDARMEGDFICSYHRRMFLNMRTQ